MADNADLVELFAEAEKKKSERDGFTIGIGGRRFDVWPGQLTYRERRMLFRHCSMDVFDAVALLNAGEGTIDSVTTMVAVSMYQETKKVPSMEGLSAWVEARLLDPDDELTAELLSFDEVNGISTDLDDPVEVGEVEVADPL